METLRRIFRLTRPYWARVLIALICGLAVSGVMAAIAWLVKPALDIIFLNKQYQYLKFLPIGVIALFTLKGALHVAQQYLMKSAGLALTRDTQSALHNHILYMPVRYFDKESSGVVISRVINDVTIIRNVFAEVLRASMIELPKVFVLMGIAFYRKWDVTLVSLALVPVLAITARKFGKKVKHRSREAQSHMSFLTHRLNESVAGIKVIKIFNRESYRNSKFIKDCYNVYTANIKAVKYVELNKLVIDFMTGVAISIVLLYGGGQVVSGHITPGDFASILTAIYLVFSPVKQVGEGYTSLQNVRAAVERIDHVLNTDLEYRGREKLIGFNDSLCFENVTFAYSEDTPNVLTNVNLTVKKGEVVAIVGASGSGKTTLINLIPRFYMPTQGVVKIDGVDLKNADIESLRSLIAVVSQDVILFNETIRDNIAFGNGDVSDESIREAAEAAYATEFIERLPAGYETMVGERGSTLSGGQRQRVAIARAIIKNPPLLILDEATSSLDSVSEAFVKKALETVMKNRTTIVIAHRLSTIQNADRIVVFEHGVIKDIGSHNELIEKDKTYMKLYQTYVFPEV